MTQGKESKVKKFIDETVEEVKKVFSHESKHENEDAKDLSEKEEGKDLK